MIIVLKTTYYKKMMFLVFEKHGQKREVLTHILYKARR